MALKNLENLVKIGELNEEPVDKKNLKDWLPQLQIVWMMFLMGSFPMLAVLT